jgi:hypothetical protein
MMFPCVCTRWLRPVECCVMAAIAFLIASATDAPQVQGKDEFEGWQSVEIGQRGDLTVRLRVMRQATLAEKNWLAIEFENRGDRDIELVHPKYGIRYEAYDLKTGALWQSGSLASGNEGDLFPQHRAITSGRSLVAKHSTWRVVDHPSFVSAALLGLPLQDGLLIKADLFAQVEVKDEGVAVDSSRHCRFEFRWLDPDEAGFERMRSRLNDLFDNAQGDLQSAYTLHALLKIPAVARIVSAQQTLAALNRYVHPYWGRAYLLEHLNEHFASDSAVVDRFRQRLAARDKTVIEDLRKTPRIWDRSFLDLLIERFKADPASSRAILDILAQHGAPQDSDEQLAQRLSGALLKQPAFQATNRRKGREPDDVEAWRVMDCLELLGKTRDQALIPLIAPYLDDEARGLNPRFLALITAMPPLRVCDAALVAILTILDGDAKAAAVPLPGGKPIVRTSIDEREQAADQHRDKLIEQLKRRLEAPKVETNRR